MQYPPDQPPPSYPYPQPQPSSAPPPVQPGPNRPWYRRMRKRTWIIIIVVVLVIGTINAIATGGKGIGNQASSPTPTQAAQSQATSSPTAKPTVHYPPKTKADLLGLAAQGDASAIHEFHSESVGLTGVCPQPKRLVTVDPSITGKKLAEDLLAYFYANQLDNPCGSVVFAFHTQAEANGDNGYTAGRVLLDTTDQSGSVNTDPNATGLTYSLTLDTGDVATGQEYTVSYAG